MNAAYVLGPERSGLSPAMLQRCRHVVRIPTRFALNLAVAGALVLYDRLLQHGRFAERPVGSRGAAACRSRCPPRHGPPRFRRNIPDWVAERDRSHDPSRACRVRSSRRISRRMRLIAALLTLVLAVPAGAQAQPKPQARQSRSAAPAARRNSASSTTGSPRRIRKSGQTTCYAFVRAKNSVPALPGRGEVVLTVTERPTGRDTVAISAGFSIRARTPR